MGLPSAFITTGKAVGGVLGAFGAAVGSVAIKKPGSVVTAVEQVRNIFSGEMETPRDKANAVKDIFEVTKDFFTSAFENVKSEDKNLAYDFRSPEDIAKDPFKATVFDKTQEEKDVEDAFSAANDIFNFK